MGRQVDEGDIHIIATRFLNFREWRRIGHALGIDFGSMDYIQQMSNIHVSDFSACSREMLRVWLNLKENCTWEALIETLKTEGLNGKAYEMEKYIKSLPALAPSHRPSSPRHPSTQPSNPQPSSPRHPSTQPSSHGAKEESESDGENENVLENVRAGVVLLRSPCTFGSGFFVSPTTIITNYHVIDSSTNGIVEVFLMSDTMEAEKIEGKIVSKDDKRDLAAVEVDTKARNIPVLKLRSPTLKVGATVYAIGNPAVNLSKSNHPCRNTITKGIISETCRKAEEIGLTDGIDYIQTDAFIRGGNSGGPLIDKNGNVIGILTSSFYTGISFAIPTKYIKDFYDQMDSKPFKVSQDVSESSSCFLGFSAVSLSLDELENLKQEGIGQFVTPGVLINDVITDTPASRANLACDDVIVAVNNVPVKKPSDIVTNIKSGCNAFCVFRKTEFIIINLST